VATSRALVKKLGILCMVKSAILLALRNSLRFIASPR
jgi:hypothetical protein